MTDLSFSSSRDATAAGAIKRPEREMTETIMSSQAVNHNDERNSVCVCVCVCVCVLTCGPGRGFVTGRQAGIILSSLLLWMSWRQKWPWAPAATAAWASNLAEIFLNCNFSYFPVCIKRWKITPSFVLSLWGDALILVYPLHLGLLP